MKQEIKERIVKIRNGEVPDGYKETKIGIIPEAWHAKVLGEIFNFEGGYTASRDQLGDSGIAYLHYGDIHTSSKTTINLNDEIDMIPKLEIDISNIPTKNMIEDGDVIFADASEDYDGIGKSMTVFNPKNMPFINGLHTIIAKKKNGGLDNHFSRYFLQNYTVKKQIMIRSQGAKVLGISGKQLAKVEVCVPLDSEQEKIAQILSTWDKAIELKKKLIEEKKQFKKGLMQKLLSGEVRFPGFIDEWKECELNDICTFLKGSGLSKEQLSNKGQNECILYGELYTKYPEVIEEVVSRTNENESVLSEKDDVLIPASTTTTGIDLANATALKKGKVILGGDINILRNSYSKFNSEFLAYYLTHNRKFELARKAQGITIVHLYGAHMKKISIKIPSTKEQEKIADTFSKIEKNLNFLSKQIEVLKQQKKGLMQLLLTGIVRVKGEN